MLRNKEKARQQFSPTQDDQNAKADYTNMKIMYQAGSKHEDTP